MRQYFKYRQKGIEDVMLNQQKYQDVLLRKIIRANRNTERFGNGPTNLLDDVQKLLQVGPGDNQDHLGNKAAHPQRTQLE